MLPALLGPSTQFPHPLRRTLFQLRVIFVLPRDKFIEGFQLTQPHELAFGHPGQKAAGLTAAHQSVDVLNQLLGETTCVRLRLFITVTSRNTR